MDNNGLHGLNVLSLFDGISCGMVALKRAGFTVNNYYAFEIDKNAIKCKSGNANDSKHFAKKTAAITNFRFERGAKKNAE